VRRARAIVATVAIVVAVAVGLGALLLVRSSDDPGGAATGMPGPDDLQNPIGGEEVGPKVGQVAPDFSIPGLDGGTVDLSAYAGRPVVLNFWASWCQPCRREFPILEDMATGYASEGLVVIGIATNDTPADARRFARDQDASWSLAHDTRQRVAETYGVKGRGLPQTFFIGTDGKVAVRVAGELRASTIEGHVDMILP